MKYKHIQLIRTYRIIVMPMIASLLLLTSFHTVAEIESVNPGINDYYLADPDYEEWISIFESPGREVFDRRKAIVSALDIKPGMNIADIGAGTGLYTREFSLEVGPRGTVYAVDIARNFIDGIMQQSKAAGVQNVIGVVNSAKDVNLKPGSIDIAFVCDTYHHFEYPRSMLQSIHKALRNGGSLVIIDFRKVEGHSSDWVMSHTRANKETVIREIESEGFRLVEDLGFLKTNFYLRFNRE